MLQVRLLLNLAAQVPEEQLMELRLLPFMGMRFGQFLLVAETLQVVPLLFKMLILVLPIRALRIVLHPEVLIVRLEAIQMVPTLLVRLVR